MCAQTAAPSSLRKHMCCGLTVGGLGGTPRAWHRLSWGPRVDMHGSRAVNLVTNAPSWSCRDRANTGTLKAAPSGRREPAGKLTHAEPFLGGQGRTGKPELGVPAAPGAPASTRHDLEGAVPPKGTHSFDGGFWFGPKCEPRHPRKLYKDAFQTVSSQKFLSFR